MTTPPIQTLTDELLGEIEKQGFTFGSTLEHLAREIRTLRAENAEYSDVLERHGKLQMTSAFIAAERDAALAENARMAARIEQLRLPYTKTCERMWALEAENADLRKDAGRWRYIRDLIHPLDIVDFQEARDSFGMRPTENISAQCDTAIDTAMEQAK